MDEKPGPPPPREAARTEPGPVERYGPLELRRLRKEDGRELIVYAHGRDPAPGGSDASGDADRPGGEGAGAGSG